MNELIRDFGFRVLGSEVYPCARGGQGSEVGLWLLVSGSWWPLMLDTGFSILDNAIP